MTDNDFYIPQSIDQTENITINNVETVEFSMIHRGNALASVHKESNIASDQVKEISGQCHPEKGLLKSRLPYVKPRLKKIPNQSMREM